MRKSTAQENTNIFKRGVSEDQTLTWVQIHLAAETKLRDEDEVTENDKAEALKQRTFMGAFLIHCMTLLDGDRRLLLNSSEPYYFSYHPEFSQFSQSGAIELTVKGKVSYFTIGDITLVDIPGQSLFLWSKTDARLGTESLYLNMLRPGSYSPPSNAWSRNATPKANFSTVYNRNTVCFKNEISFELRKDTSESYHECVRPAATRHLTPLMATVIRNAYGNCSDEYITHVESELERLGKFHRKIDGLIDQSIERLTREEEKLQARLNSRFAFWRTSLQTSKNLKLFKLERLKQFRSELHNNGYDVKSAADTVIKADDDHKLLFKRQHLFFGMSRTAKLFQQLDREAMRKARDDRRSQQKELVIQGRVPSH